MVSWKFLFFSFPDFPSCCVLSYDILDLQWSQRLQSSVYEYYSKSAVDQNSISFSLHFIAKLSAHQYVVVFFFSEGIWALDGIPVTPNLWPNWFQAVTFWQIICKLKSFSYWPNVIPWDFVPGNRCHLIKILKLVMKLNKENIQCKFMQILGILTNTIII